MPVYNGELYLEEALDSLLAQTFGDFEIVITDNASTDATGAICRTYAERDSRIRYVRNRANYGAIHNFNSTFRLTRGEYFKWAAYDDVCEPEFLARCVSALDGDQDIVLACSRISGIDEAGRPTDIITRPGHGRGLLSGFSLEEGDRVLSPTDPDPVVRWRFTMRYLWWTPHLYGVIRSAVLERTKLHPSHYNGDQILLAELALHGRFHEIQEDLLHVRLHAGRTSRTAGARQRIVVAHPELAGSELWLRIRAALAYPERFVEHIASIVRAPLTAWQRWACFVELGATVVRWGRARAKRPIA